MKIKQLLSVYEANRYECLLILLAALLFVIGLLPPAYRGNDEVRYTRIAEEMMSGPHGWQGFFLLHNVGEVYTQKPPLFFWLAGFSQLAMPGSALQAARLPSLVSGLALLVAVIALGRMLFGRGVGLLAAGLLLAMPQMLFYGCSARLDGILLLGVTLAFLGVWRIDRGIGSHTRNLLLLHGSIGMAMLTKGPLGLLLPLLGAFGYLAIERRLFVLRKLVSWWALAISVLPLLLWAAVAIALAPHSGSFFGETVVDNLYGRFFEGTSHAQPVGYYLKVLPRVFMPWTLLWPAVAWIAYREVFSSATPPTESTAARRRGWVFLLSWVLGLFLFFTICAGKRSAYLLPIFPALSLLCADALLAALARLANPGKWLRGVALTTIALVGVVGVTFLMWPQIVEEKFLPFVLGGGLVAVSVTFLVLQQSIPRDALLVPRSLGLILLLVVVLEFFGALFLFPYYKTRDPNKPVDGKKVDLSLRQEMDLHGAAFQHMDA